MKVENYADLSDALSNTFGYPVIGVCQDGGILCHTCMDNEVELIRDAIESDDDPQWRVEAVEAHFEGPAIQCEHCYGSVEAAYGDPED